ncbi:MAG: hypothetical protein QOC76_145 [Mycobacterium sp.]|jgi:hypothetical protein|nr:hypothetical protein [Mycobacterium sp.]
MTAALGHPDNERTRRAPVDAGQFSPPAPMRGSGWSDVLQG